MNTKVLLGMVRECLLVLGDAPGSSPAVASSAPARSMGQGGMMDGGWGTLSILGGSFN